MNKPWVEPKANHEATFRGLDVPEITTAHNLGCLVERFDAFLALIEQEEKKDDETRYPQGGNTPIVSEDDIRRTLIENAREGGRLAANRAWSNLIGAQDTLDPSQEGEVWLNVGYTLVSKGAFPSCLDGARFAGFQSAIDFLKEQGQRSEVGQAIVSVLESELSKRSKQ